MTVSLLTGRTYSRSALFALGWMLTVTFAALGIGSAAPASAATSTCQYATGGSAAHTSEVCWIDFSDANFATAASPGITPYGTAGGQHYTVDVGGGFTMEFDLQYEAGGGTPAVHPLGNGYAGSWLGNVGYTGTSGNRSLSTQGPTAANGDAIQMNNIKVYQTSDNTPLTGYRIVSADSEATGSGEQIIFRSHTPMSQIENSGATCLGAGTSVTSNVVTCDGDASSQGTAAVFAATDAGWSRTDRKTSNGTEVEATAFGIILPPVVDVPVVNPKVAVGVLALIVLGGAVFLVRRRATHGRP